MSLRTDIQQAQKEAMKEKQEAKLSTLRLLWSAIRNAEIDKQRELSEEEILEVIAKQVKQLRDALKDFVVGNREDLIEKTKTEIVLLEVYLPKQMTEEELRAVASKILSDNNITENKDAGRAMGLIMKEVKGRTDGNKVKEIVSALLQTN